MLCYQIRSGNERSELSRVFDMTTAANAAGDAITPIHAPTNLVLTLPPKTCPDVEKQNSAEEAPVINVSTIAVDDTELGMQDNSNVPHMSLPSLFWFFFYNFGF